MKNQVIITLLTFSILSGVNATADEVAVNAWECSSDESSGGAASCYVTNVRFMPGGKPYVLAKLHDPNSPKKTNCSRIQVRVDQTANSVVEVRGIEALLLVALTTGLPIKYYVKKRDGSLCNVSSVTVSKPGH